jgi:hypothetical protein
VTETDTGDLDNVPTGELELALGVFQNTTFPSHHEKMLAAGFQQRIDQALKARA